MEGEQIKLGTPQVIYDTKRIEASPPIPCDMCLGGMDAPWYIGAYIGELLTYIICANDCININKATDTCASCIPDPTDERVCDNCGKEYRRAAPIATEVAA